MWFKNDSCSKAIKTIHAIKPIYVLQLFLLIMLIIFLLQDNAILLRAWNHWNNNLLSMIWDMFWRIGKIYFLFFIKQNIKSNLQNIFLVYFSIVYFRWASYLFLVLSVDTRLHFRYSSRIFFFVSLQFKELLQRIKSIYYRF